MRTFNFKNDDLVSFDNGSFSGTGRIIGAASTEQAHIGATFIIDVEESSIPIPSNAYPFEAVVMQEIFISKRAVN